VGGVSAKPVGDPEPVADTNNESKSAEPETETEEQAETTMPEADETPSATEPERPKVRGPIAFDSPEPQADSPSSDQSDTSTNKTTSDPASTGEEDQEAA
jgi:hypothetical protein